MRKKEMTIVFIFICIFVVFYTSETEYYQEPILPNKIIGYTKLAKSLVNKLPDLLNNLNKVNYFRSLPISKSSNNSIDEGICTLPVLDPWNEEAKKLVKKIPRYDECKKHSPLSYVYDKHLFIDQNINTTHYSGKITDCQYSKVIRTSDKKEYYKLGNFFI